MIRKILVPLDGSSNSLRGLDFAINVAKQFNALIIGLYVVQEPKYFQRNHSKNG